MRTSVSLAVAATLMGFAAGAHAQQSLEPYETEQPTEPVAEPAPIAPAQVPVQAPIDPYSAYPAAPAYGAQAPSAAPPVAPADLGRGPSVYYAPSARGFCGCRTTAPCYRLTPRLVRKRVWDGVRRFSLGVHMGFLTLNQKVGNDQVTLGGAGFQLRLRSAGRWGFEASQSFMHGSYWSGQWQRDSFPFALSLMLYLFPNNEGRHFNLYGVAGVGLVADSVSLNDENRQRVSQDFTEVELHAGLGAEFRFKWFGIEADARYISLWRDNSTTPAAYYGDLKGAPVQASSYGVQGNLTLSLWF